MTQSPAGPKPAFDLNETLVKFEYNDEGHYDPWTIGDACEGTQIFGATGSGKTSGSGRAIAKAFLDSGFGGLVLCAKIDERQLWQEYAAETGRSDDLIIFSPENPWRFNFLDYEYNRKGRGGGMTETIAQLFARALEMAENGQQNNEESFWRRAQLRMLRNAIELIGVALNRISLEDIYKLIISAPQEPDEIISEGWQQASYCHYLAGLADAAIESASPERKHDYDIAIDYWYTEFPGMDPRTRSSVVAGFTSMADGFLRGPPRTLFCTDRNITPEMSFDGAIFVLDLSPMEFGDTGTLSQGIFKYVWQQAVLRRDIRANGRPVFLWADESQFFVNSYDARFQTVARSFRACTVYLTQNISSYQTEIGGSHAESRVNALLGNFQTKIGHTNGDATTNKWFAEQIGRRFRSVTSVGASKTGSSTSDSGANAQVSQQLHYQIEPAEFLELRNGGERNGLIVDAVLMKAGRRFGTEGYAFRPVSFRQDERK